MEIRLTFEEVKTNHPNLIDVLMEKLNSSRTKEKGKLPQEYEWYYSYGVTVKGMSFDEMIHDVISRKEPEEKSTQDIMNEQLKSVLGLSLVISSGRTKRYYTLPDKPTLFIQKFSEMSLKGIDEKKKEEDRLSKLTPEERAREAQEHINELTGMGGFVGFNIGPNGIKKIEPKKIEYDLDEVLEKISRVGMEGLTDGEREFLKNESA